MDDPWDWDNGRVVQELCTENRSWSPLSSNKLALPDHLQSALTEHQVDGEALLTYDHKELCKDLGIKILKHKSTFQNAVAEFRRRSKRYRVHQKRLASDSDSEELPTNEPDEKQRRARLQNGLASSDASLSSAVTNGLPYKDVATVNVSNDARSKNLTEQLASLGKCTSDFDISPSTTTLNSVEQQLPRPASGEPVQKKRRIAPINISKDIDAHANRIIPTEADVLLSRRGPPVPSSSYAGSYLDEGAVTRFDIINGSPSGLEDEKSPKKPFQAHQRHVFEGQPLLHTNRIVPGRRLQVHRFMKRRLLGKNGKNGTTPAVATKSDTVPGSMDPSNDEVLPLYGDSDEDEEYDSDLWKEIEDEKAAPVVPSKGLGEEEIGTILDDVIEKYATEWKEAKLSNLARKANRLWNEARRHGIKKEIDNVKLALQQYDSRIAKYREEFPRYGRQWQAADLRRTAAIFEQTVKDREHASWLLSVLTSPTEPKKLPALPRQSARPHTRPTRPDAEEDEEILTSESEDGLDDFIVNDVETPNTIDDGPLMDHMDEDAISGDEREIENEIVSNDTVSPERAAQVSLNGNNRHDPQTPSRTQTQAVIDLTTPLTNRSATSVPSVLKNGKVSKSKGVALTDKSKPKNNQPSLDMAIDDLESPEQRIAKELTKMDYVYLSFIFSIAAHIPAEDIWMDLILRAMEKEEFPKAPYTGGRKDDLIAYTLIRLFEMYKDDCHYSLKRYKSLTAADKQRILGLRSENNSYDFKNFISFLRRLSDRFDWKPPEQRRIKNQTAHAALSSAGVEQPGQASGSVDDDSSGNLNSENDEASPSKTPKRKEPIRNQEAATRRQDDQHRMTELAKRREMLRAKLATGAIKAGNQQRVIINESKRDDQGFVYVHDEIAERIKEHQVEGVRFMWNQIVDATTRQGCLLAHTMGLGKTMQIVTLLVAIAEASNAPDSTISDQIPDELRESKTLVLCPPTLVNNWLDEMLTWSPENHKLGEIFKIDSSQTPAERTAYVNMWNSQGGILILGYSLFRLMIGANPTVEDMLINGPNLVVADEAHVLKNPTSKVHRSTATFRTRSRIALTGSPLANKVEEYFAMIDWIAPGYLGNLGEFRSYYAIPIKDGLSEDSSLYERKKALMRLRVLKHDVEPKVNRTTIAVLKNDIPKKMEFVLSVPLTDTQRLAYELYIRFHQDNMGTATAQTFAAANSLALICAHPFIFMERLKEAKNEKNHSSAGASTESNITLPDQLISEEMALLRNAEKDNKLDELEMSWKILLLLGILDESKRLGDHVLLFSHSIGTLNYLERVLRKKKYAFQRLDGKTDMAERQGMVKDFNQGQHDIFLISTTAGGLGLNITGANRVIIFDSKYNPQHEQQAVGRAYRIGQKKPVFVYRFVCGGTFEEKLLNQAVWKMQLTSRVVDKRNPIPKTQRFNEGFTMPSNPEQKDLTDYRGHDVVLDQVISQHAEGIRSITMMDTFEEEEFENAHLTAADLEETQREILINQARRLGQPPPQSFPTYHQTASPEASASAPVDPMVTDGEQQPKSPVLSLTNEFPQIYSGTPSRSRAPAHAHQQMTTPQQASLQPVRGAVTHSRHSAEPSTPVRIDSGGNWEKLAAFKGELAHAFTVNADPDEHAHRRQVAHDLTVKIWEKTQQQPIEIQSATRWAVINAASSRRVVDAICHGHVPPDELVKTSPDKIRKWHERLDGLSQTDYERRKAVPWPPAQSDPQHLLTALHKMSSTPQREAMNGQQPVKLHRTDDEEVIKAVMENRKSKQQLPSSPSPSASISANGTPHGPPRLPAWATNAVESRQQDAAGAQRPPAKSPFK